MNQSAFHIFPCRGTLGTKTFFIDAKLLEEDCDERPYGFSFAFQVAPHRRRLCGSAHRRCRICPIHGTGSTASGCSELA